MVELVDLNDDEGQQEEDNSAAIEGSVDVGTFSFLPWRMGWLQKQDPLNDEKESGAIEKLGLRCQNLKEYWQGRSYRMGGEKGHYGGL